MNVHRLATIARLELVQRMRSVAWYVLLGVFALLLIGVTWLAFLAWGTSNERGPGIYSTVVLITLLLAVLVSPTLSGNSINGDRDAATLAPVQVTLATTGEILVGKFLAAWATGLAFAVVAIPFLVIATAAGGVSGWVVLVSLVVLVVEIGVVSAIGTALSAILARPLFSVATTYLVVAALTVGTLIVFGLVGAGVRTEVTQSYRVVTYQGDGIVCADRWETTTFEVPRFDTVWWVLAANPFVILADATPTQYDARGWPVDLFGQIKSGVRTAQQPPPSEQRYDECAPSTGDDTTPRDIIAETVPSWFVGLGAQLLLAGGLMAWAYRRTRTPARTLPRGTRIA
ncbi:ABC transporter permease [Microbacterium sp. zg.Y625]|uniref:ABC transporter permease n=1 Tax=Microbacterium jiangjiandongii TaxID=3049071 RepID=UPI00214BEE2D|nr:MULTISPECIES: ABC transporter permease [unclassified Microbacterium]MCR2793601.1 ABC transporter permease [Microbacterium sp. zg.Y625]WIM25950.1 ABC transporter permease [Microbacterium sp. zg-Y625]